MRLVRSLGSLLLPLLLIVGCSQPPESVGVPEAPNPPRARPLPWQVGAACRTDPRHAISSRDQLAETCRHDHNQGGTDFVGLVLSGGGVKASTFGGEAMFMLDRFGLLAEVDMIASASGGSLPAAYYALSCDAWDAACLSRSPRPPVWDYASGMQVMSAGFMPLVTTSKALLLVPLVPHTLSAQQFADHLERNAFGGDPAAPFRMRQLNPRRPDIYLTAALVGQNRFLTDLRRSGPHQGQNFLRYLRRRNADQYFHFAFAQPYFGQLRTDLGSMPLSFAVAASGAIPILFDYARLNDHSLDRQHPAQLLLTDGGNNDNQGLMEVYFTLLEALAGQARSPQAPARMGPRDRVLVFVVNSSLTETTGVGLSPQSDPSRGSSLANLINRVSTATDIYSGDGYSLREQLYRRELEALRRHLATDPATAQRWSHWHPDSGTVSPVLALEIGLTTLDEFPAGGRDAAQRVASGLAVAQKATIVEAAEPARRQATRTAANAAGNAAAPWPGVYDPDAVELAARQRTHLAAFDRLRDPEARKRLGLSALHPQCLFEKSKELESSLDALAELAPNALACLREAARWATALRVQELCVLRENDAALLEAKRQEIGRTVLNQPGVAPGTASLDVICAPGGLRLLRSPDPTPTLDCKLELDAIDDPNSTLDTPLRHFVEANRTRLAQPGAGASMTGQLPDRNCLVQDARWSPPTPSAPEPLRARRPGRTPH